jgi:hypothetical protein
VVCVRHLTGVVESGMTKEQELLMQLAATVESDDLTDDWMLLMEAWLDALHGR